MLLQVGEVWLINYLIAPTYISMYILVNTLVSLEFYSMFSSTCHVYLASYGVKEIQTAAQAY